MRTLLACVLSACRVITWHHGKLWYLDTLLGSCCLLVWDCVLTLELSEHISTSLSMQGTLWLPSPWYTGSARAASW